MATDDAKLLAFNTLNAESEDDAKKARTPAAAPAADIWGVEHCCVREFWAVVETNGSLVRGRNVTYCRKISLGIYEVYFTGDVSNGVFNATIGRPGYATAPPGEITVALRASPGPYNPFTISMTKGVWVQTWDSAGKPADREFHLMVHTH
jgi:hypothetical protein